MASVDEEKFRRAVLSILSALLLPDLGEIPDVKPPVSARAGQDGLVMGRPLDLGGGKGISQSLREARQICSTWKISSLWLSKLCSLSLRFLRSQRATVLSAEPVARMNSEYGLKLRQLT